MIRGSDPVIETETLRIHVVTAGAANVYLLELEEGLVMVDAGLSYAANTIQNRIEQLGGNLCLIFITHAHIDHYGAAAAVRRITGAPIAIHSADAAAMGAGETQLGNVRNWEWTERPLPTVERMIRVEPTAANILVEDGERLTECGLDATVVHTPGHTAGSSTLLVEEAYAFAGDLISTAGGLHVQTSYAQDWSQVAPSIEKLRALEPAYVFPGHGREGVTGAMFQTMEITGPALPAPPTHLRPNRRTSLGRERRRLQPVAFKLDRMRELLQPGNDQAKADKLQPNCVEVAQRRHDQRRDDRGHQRPREDKKIVREGGNQPAQKEHDQDKDTG
jgi:glyoxylase-like metal-dependent hydrolase (beta-lactamase superfamily II)